jgi:2-polyprenyl-3-methyl-5-hydroxy-6-metoxy-1,4-benzoquinol methylase
LSLQDFRFLAAFTDAITPRAAARTVGSAWDAHYSHLAQALITMGILARADGSQDEPDRRNEFAKAAFDDHAADWLKSSYTSRPDHFVHARLNLTIAWIEHLAAGRHGFIVDMGCGDGRLLIELARRGHRAHGIDSSEAMVTFCRQRVAREAIEIRRRISFQHGDATACSASDADFVTALGLMAWCDHADRLLDTARNVLVDKGYSIVGFPNALVTPDGPIWTLNPGEYSDVIATLMTCTLQVTRLEPRAWIERYRDACRVASLGLQEIATDSQCDRRSPRYHERSRAPTGERRYAPDEVQRLARNSSFDVATWAGIGDTRSVFDYLFTEVVAAEMNVPLAAIRSLPCGLLWSTGFLALLAASPRDSSQRRP